MKWFWRFCLCGLIGSLLMWSLPNRLKPYHFNRWEKDYKILFAQYTTEYGFAPSGIVVAHHVKAFDSSSLGRTGVELNPIREAWFKTGFRSKIPWPTDSRRLEYDEWGPNQWRTDEGVKITHVGEVYCVPYSLIAILCAIPLFLRGSLALLKILTVKQGRG